MAVIWWWPPIPGPRATRPGVYSPRCNDTSWDGEEMLRACVGVPDIEAVFRSLYSGLGLRPGHLRQPERLAVHLHLADQTVPMIRLRPQGQHFSWVPLRTVFEAQRRAASRLPCSNRQTVDVRKTQPGVARSCPEFRAHFISAHAVGQPAADAAGITDPPSRQAPTQISRLWHWELPSG